MKRVLTAEQSANLIALGVDPSKASENTEYGAWADAEGNQPLFTLADMFAIMSEWVFVEDGHGLFFRMGVCCDNVKYFAEYSDYCGCDFGTHSTAEEQIDALYKLLVYCIESETITIK